MHELLRIFKLTGKLDWIGIRPAKGQVLGILDQVEVIQDVGLTGDHRGQRICLESWWLLWN